MHCLRLSRKIKWRSLRLKEKPGANNITKHLGKMKTELGLTDIQVSQMKSQRESMQTKFKAIMENESLSREQKKEQFQALKAKGKEQHKKIFTADQLKKMEEMKKKD